MASLNEKTSTPNEPKIVPIPAHPNNTTPTSTSTSTNTTKPKADLLSLPPEVHHLITTHLPYPDLLSLKLSHPHFMTLLHDQPTVRQRIAWILSRAQIYLPIPHDSRTNFRTDAAFVSNAEVGRILRRRRQHAECVDHSLSRRLVWLRNQKADGATLALRCLVNDGHDCPRLVALQAKTLRHERTLRRRLLRRLGWSSPFWDAGAHYWEIQQSRPPMWLATLDPRAWTYITVRFLSRRGIHVPALYFWPALVLALVLGMFGARAYEVTFRGVWESIVGALCRWFEAMSKDWAHELHLPP